MIHALALVATVHIKDFAFSPARTAVAVGTRVRFINDDQDAHTVSSTTRAFDSGGLDTGDVWTRAFARPGTYAYICALHPYTHGTIVFVRRGGRGDHRAIGRAARCRTPRASARPRGLARVRGGVRHRSAPERLSLEPGARRVGDPSHRAGSARAQPLPPCAVRGIGAGCAAREGDLRARRFVALRRQRCGARVGARRRAGRPGVGDARAVRSPGSR